MSDPVPPPLIHDAWETCWYVPGHDPEEAWVVGDPAEHTIELIYMRAVPPPPPGERGDHEDTSVLRDERGRFQRNWWWETCQPHAPGALPFLEIRPLPS